MRCFSVGRAAPWLVHCFRNSGDLTFPLSYNTFSGKTTSTVDDSNLSIDVLVDDLFELLRVVFPDPVSTPTLLVSLPWSLLRGHIYD